ncbi:MAG: DUF4350 domain-containing protein [Gammaproteobacteria bacterium]|nr:DUF4350 domain-containing protein [Gammaproteobacteria bacterium]MDX2459938.1 DUF4350 domain-containing protein [Gammaproteobacteria bacterium]
MKDRLLTIAGGLLAFALVVILLVPIQKDISEQISRPLSTDRGRAGLQGLQRWLEQGGVQADALRRRYTALAASLDLQPIGNLLIVSLPQLAPSKPDELEALRIWIAQGNSVLVLVAAGDAPRWMMTSPGPSSFDFLESLGFELTMQHHEGEDEQSKDDSEQKDDAASQLLKDLGALFTGDSIALRPRFPHPLTRDVASVSARSFESLDRGWYLTGTAGGRLVLPLLGDVDRGAAFWETRVGRGRMWVSRYSGLFANASLGEADNARFLANLVSAALGSHGRVLFDDMHQGATDLYDAKAFFRDPRFANTLLFAVGFWLLYLVGRSRRLAPAREVVSRYYAADLARAMAGFFVRRLGAVTVERQLFLFFFNDIRGRYGMPANGQPVWSMLSGMSRVSADDISVLRSHYERTAATRKPDLVAITRLMQRTRESLL